MRDNRPMHPLEMEMEALREENTQLKEALELLLSGVTEDGDEGE